MTAWGRHTYRLIVRDGATIFRVGFYDEWEMREAWVMLHEFTDEFDAAAFVSYLNGGAEPRWLAAGQFPQQRNP